jgi:hypothetical protein
MCTDGRFVELPDRDQMRVYAPSLRQAVAQEPELLAFDAARSKRSIWRPWRPPIPAWAIPLSRRGCC